MMSDLGKYEVTVLSAYGAALLLIAILIWLSWLRGRHVYNALRTVEKRRTAARDTEMGAAQNDGKVHAHG